MTVERNQRGWSAEATPEREPFGVLVVDDAGYLRGLLRLNLELSGRFRVVGEAANGVEAVERAKEHRPDLVLLDVSMPVQDGIASLPQILAVSPGSKVVMLSGLDARRLAPIALERGAAAYLEKGIEPDRLVEELLGVLVA